MMFIPEKNETIKNVIYTSLTSQEKNIKNLKEFGFFSYSIFPEGPYENPTHLVIGFSFMDFDKIYDYSGKEFIENTYKGFEVQRKYKAINTEFDIAFKVNIEKYQKMFEKKKKKMTEEEKQKLDEEKEKLRPELEKFAKETADKLCNFRIAFSCSVLDKMLREIQEKKVPNLLSIHLNAKNILHLLPTDDRVKLIYGIDFEQSTDVSLCRNFLQELSEAKRHVTNCIGATTYGETDIVPKEIINVDQPKKYSNGLVYFELYAKNYNLVKNYFGYFITFREYIQFHIHSIKAFLHIRMNKKGKEWLTKLVGCQIIPQDYLNSLDIAEEYNRMNKKEENRKKFIEESKKLQGK